MKKSYAALAVLLVFASWVPTLLGQDAEEKPREPKPIELEDILAWKGIRNAGLSNDGHWLAYRLSPAEGDGKVIVRETDGEKEHTFPAGESTGGSIAFSDDSNWLAFTIYPKREEAKKLKKQKKKSFNKVGLVDLSTGKSIEFEKVRTFAFSEEIATWIALHRYAPERQGSGKEKWSGSDLILHELSTSKELNIGNVSEFAFDKEGRRLAMIIDAEEKSGNGVQCRDMVSGVVSALDNGKAVYKMLTWTESGDGLAVLKGVEDEDYEEELYSVIGFTDFSSSSLTKVVYDPEADESFPKGMTVSPNRSPFWTEDRSAILFGIHDVEKKEEEEEKEKEKDGHKEDAEGEKEEKEKEGKDGKPEEKEKKPDKKRTEKEEDEELPEMVIWHWLDKRLQSMQQVQESRDKNFSYLCIYRVKEKKFIRLADDALRRVEAAPEHRWAVGFDNRDYELPGNLDGRRYQDVYAVNLETGERKMACKKCQWPFSPSPDGTHFLYYEDGHYYTYDMAGDQVFNITRDIPSSFVDEEDDHNVVKPPVRPVGWTKGGTSVLLYDNWDVWSAPVFGGGGTNLTVNGKKDGIKYQGRIRLDPDEKGIDLAGAVYFNAYGEWTKKRGIARVDGGVPGAKMLLWDDASFSRLMKAKDADLYLYTKETHKDYPDYYATDSALQKGRRITHANPQQKDLLWSKGAMLLDYESSKGKRLQAALYLPADHEEGKCYPTIVYIYEKLSQSLNRFYSPSARGFNKSVYTSNGYAVLMPDITYTLNDPGMSAVWCVLPAIEAAIATGVVDRDRVAIHGHSWGGYQTAFLITQTDAFRAAVAGAALTNLVSMYSSIYWNSGSANQPIFERSQGRFEGGYWDNIEAYTRNSPVYYATNVTTPLLLLHNDKDGAVDWNQGIEYFNTLRRLDKPVVMLQYKGENHGLRKPENQKDYTVRMREFFDHHLKGKSAPDWLKKGVPHLDLEKHLEERSKKERGGKEKNRTEV